VWRSFFVSFSTYQFANTEQNSCIQQFILGIRTEESGRAINKSRKRKETVLSMLQEANQSRRVPVDENMVELIYHIEHYFDTWHKVKNARAFSVPFCVIYLWLFILIRQSSLAKKLLI